MPAVRRVGQDSPAPKPLENASDQILGRLNVVERVLRAVVPVDEDRLYTRREVAALLGVSVRTVDRRRMRGHLKVVRRGRTILILGSSILQANQEKRQIVVEVLRL